MKVVTKMLIKILNTMAQLPKGYSEKDSSNPAVMARQLRTMYSEGSLNEIDCTLMIFGSVKNPEITTPHLIIANSRSELISDYPDQGETGLGKYHRSEDDIQEGYMYARQNGYRLFLIDRIPLSSLDRLCSTLVMSVSALSRGLITNYYDKSESDSSTIQTTPLVSEFSQREA